MVARAGVSVYEVMLPGRSSLLAALRDPRELNVEIANVVPTLAGHRFLLLTTMKRDGTPVATPVWFAAVGGRLVAATAADAWKVKRLRHNPSATIAPCDARGRQLGRAVPVVGEILGAADQPEARDALHRRYGTSLSAIELVHRLRAGGRAPRQAYLALTPTPAQSAAAVEQRARRAA
jgi:PPOX class probable F420-dependent enzyme